MKNIEQLAKKFGTEIEKELPADAKFILLLVKKEGGKCATNMKEPLRSTYLRKVADFSANKGNGIIFIEINSEDLH